MTKRQWTREMYMQLEELLIHTDAKKQKEKISVKLGISRLDLNYRIRILNERKNILTWRPQEFEALNTARSFDEFLVSFRNIYWNNFSAEIAKDHWNQRDDYLHEYKKEQAKIHNVVPETKKIVVHAPAERRPAIIDEYEVFRKILETLQELLQVQKDVYALLKEQGRSG